MKFLLLCFLIPTCSFGQQLLPEKDGKVVYEEVDSVTAPKDELYQRSKIWLVNSFKSAKEVIQIDDKGSGQIIGKGNFDYPITVIFETAMWTCYFSVQIDCRDNKARIRIYDIDSKSGGEATAEYFNQYAKHSQKHIKTINDKILGILYSFKNELGKKSKDDF